MSITSTLVERAEIQFREAAEVLRPFVGCFWTITAQPDATIRVVPDGSTSISTQLGQRQNSGWELRGPLVTHDERRFAAAAVMVGVRLRPGVAFMLNRVPAHTMVGRRIDLEGDPAFSELTAARLAPRTPAAYLDVLEQFLIGRLRNASVHPVVARALQEIEREGRCLQVPGIAECCGVSPRQLNRLMRLWVGYGPKRLARIARFQTTLMLIDHSPTRPPAELAAATGFFDQAHLTLDVGRFGGATPRALASTSAADFSKTRCDDLL
jgi:hypothetical protein